jgi:hypothetical protein
MTHSLRYTVDPEAVALARISKVNKQPGLGTLAAQALLSKGAGKAASGSIQIPQPSPSATRRQSHLKANQDAREEYIRLGIIKPCPEE